MILERGLAAAGDEDEFLDSGFARLFHGILDQRPVDDRQHLFGHRLGRRQEPGTEAGDGENGFAYARGHKLRLFKVQTTRQRGIPGGCSRVL